MTAVTAPPARAPAPPSASVSAPSHADQFAAALASAARPGPVQPRARGGGGEREKPDTRRHAGLETPPALALASQAAVPVPAVGARQEGGEGGDKSRGKSQPAPTALAALAAETTVNAPVGAAEVGARSAKIATAAASPPDLKLMVNERGALIARIAVRVDAGGAMEIVIQASSAAALPVLRAGAAQLHRRLTASACGDARIVIEHKGEAGV